jgi:hypothetical protein
LKLILKDYDDQIVDLKQQARMAPNLPERLALRTNFAAWIKNVIIPGANTTKLFMRWNDKKIP